MSSSFIPVPLEITVPREAYRYWPKPEDIRKGNEKKSVRFFFEGQVLTEFEKDKLSRLRKEIKNNCIQGMQIPKDWSENHLLRFCYGTGWKTRNAVKALISHLQWRQTVIPYGYSSLYPKVVSVLVRIYLEFRSFLCAWKRREIQTNNYNEFRPNRLQISSFYIVQHR